RLRDVVDEPLQRLALGREPEPVVDEARVARHQVLAQAQQRLVDDIAQAITGTARLRLYKGSITVAGRKSPRSMYRTDIVTFEEDSVYDQRDAQGFIKLNALRLRIASELDRK
ncbi:MAG: hypothetical protein ACM31C_04595, partial [Acidobacteriota bacterium]